MVATTVKTTTLQEQPHQLDSTITTESDNKPRQEASKHDEDNFSMVQYVENSMKDFQYHSKLETTTKIPQISPNDLQVSDVLGEGGFGVVKACHLVREAADEEDKLYAVKCLRPEVFSHKDDEDTDLKSAVAATDLLKEARFIEALDHPHIIKLHAECTLMDSEEHLQENFLVLDHLECTLESKLKEWKMKDQRHIKNLKMRKQLLHERLRVAMHIAEAIQYLHNEKDIIYRDLKMSNIGFDHQGHVKLFDFGLAKELKQDNQTDTGRYNLSGCTGSLAYMAPEVAKRWRYDKMVDVYSFAILLWEMVSLTRAFENYNTMDEMENVWAGQEVLPMADWWPVELQWLMKKCRSNFARSRPTMDVVVETFHEILHDEDDDEDEEMNMRAIKSFRFGSRRSQKLSTDSHKSSTGSGRQRGSHRKSLQAHHLKDSTESHRRKHFFGLF